MTRKDRRNNYRMTVRAVPLDNGEVAMTFESETPCGMGIHNSFGFGDAYIKFAENAIKIGYREAKNSLTELIIDAELIRS